MHMWVYCIFNLALMMKNYLSFIASGGLENLFRYIYDFMPRSVGLMLHSLWTLGFLIGGNESVGNHIHLCCTICECKIPCIQIKKLLSALILLGDNDKFNLVLLWLCYLYLVLHVPEIRNNSLPLFLTRFILPKAYF